MSATKTQSLELVVSVKGEITKSNFDDFKAMAEDRIRSLNFDLSTDEEFGQAEDDVKGLAKFEKDLKSAEDDVLKQMDEVYHLVSGIGELKKLSSASRLKLKKQIDQQKAVVRTQIKRGAIADIPIAHPQAESRIEAAMKSKRTLDSLRSAAQSESKLIQKEIAEAQEVVDQFKDKHGPDVCYDEHRLLILSRDMVEAELSRRVERKAAALKEAELKAEAEKAKAEKEAAERAEWDRREAEVKKEEQAIDSTSPATPPKIDSIPVGRSAKEASETPEEELNRFLSIVESAFGPVKQARANLKHTENIRKASRFATTLGEAWNEFKKGGDQ